MFGREEEEIKLYILLKDAAKSPYSLYTQEMYIF